MVQDPIQDHTLHLLVICFLSCSSGLWRVPIISFVNIFVFFKINFFIVVQLQLSAFSPHHFPTPSQIFVFFKREYKRILFAFLFTWKMYFFHWILSLLTFIIVVSDTFALISTILSWVFCLSYLFYVTFFLFLYNQGCPTFWCLWATHWKKKSCLGLHTKYILTHNDKTQHFK